MPKPERMLQQPVMQLDTLRAGMAQDIWRWTQGREDWITPVPNLLLFRRDAPTHLCTCRVEPSVVVIVQGAKQLLVGEQAYVYSPERFLINSLDIPANSKTVEAEPGKPCLGMGLRLDLRLMAELIAHGGLPPPRDRAAERSSALGTMTPALLEPFNRLLALLDEPAAVPVLAPLIEREIHYRLLMSDQAGRIWQMASVGSLSQRVSRAIDWLRANYAKPLRIEDLAAHVQMSSSSLHHHFRQLTAMSPLQYQKWLRLHEARNLMLNERMDAATAAFQVGYESPSQFSREYSRLFGTPPKRDIEGLRRQAGDVGQREMPSTKIGLASATA